MTLTPIAYVSKPLQSSDPDLSGKSGRQSIVIAACLGTQDYILMKV